MAYIAMMLNRFFRAIFRPGCLALSAAAMLWAAPATALSYRLVDADFPNCKGECPKVIVASGTISQNEHLQLFAFLEQSLGRGKVAQILVIESPGGFTAGGLALGYALRKLKMSVIVGRWTGDTLTGQSGLTSGTCASACVFALAGGTSRYFVTGSRVGVHRAHTGTAVLDPTTRLPVNATVDHESGHAFFRQFFRSMGVDNGVVEKLAATGSESMYWFSPGEMSRLRLARDSSARPTGGERKRR
jgi:hypothetical protein